MKQAVLPTILLVALGACSHSNELTRAKAAELIKNALYNPKVIEDTERLFPYTPLKNYGARGDELPQLRQLEKAGWITLSIRPCGFVTCVNTELSETGKERAKKWRIPGTVSVWEIPIARREFIEVTGITLPQPTMATAVFTERWIPTDDGKQLGVEPSAPNSGTVSFKLFDDGWRISP